MPYQQRTLLNNKYSKHLKMPTPVLLVKKKTKKKNSKTVSAMQAKVVLFKQTQQQLAQYFTVSSWFCQTFVIFVDVYGFLHMYFSRILHP